MYVPKGLKKGIEQGRAKGVRQKALEIAKK